MRENEAMAHDLASRCRAAGLDARVSGAGVHWQVDVATAGGRAVRVHCFWYQRALAGLFLGMNTSNARRSAEPPPAPYEGPELMVLLLDNDKRVADGRTREVTEVVACARTWAAGAGLDDLITLAAFIDRKGRAMRAVAERIDQKHRSDIGTDPSYELWVYGDGRSCRVEERNAGLSCSFFVSQAQVARVRKIDDLPHVVERWLTERVALEELARSVAAVEIERHALDLERDPARWHWLHVRDRIENATDVLAPLRPLIEALIARNVATKFYSFSSLDSFCFSASSHFPWVRDGLPAVVRTRDARFAVDHERFDLTSAVAAIEEKLEASIVRPFFGSAPHHERGELNKCFTSMGSSLRARVQQRGEWFDLVVSSTERHCIVSGGGVSFVEGERRAHAAWPSIENAATPIHHFLEGGLSLHQVISTAAR